MKHEQIHAYGLYRNGMFKDCRVPTRIQVSIIRGRMHDTGVNTKVMMS